MSEQAEQGLGKRFGKMDEREFGNMEKEVTRKIGFGGTLDIGRYVYPVKEVNVGEKNVGKYVDSCVQTVQAFGHGTDNGTAGVEFHQQVGWSVEGEVGWETGLKDGSVEAEQTQCGGS